MQSKIPDPDYDDPKELWAFFGLTLYSALILEQGIVNLAVAARTAGNQAITPQLLNDLWEEVDSKTLGQVIRIVRDSVSLPNHIEINLGLALEKRNHLAHHFFLAHDEDLLSSDGRRKIIDELREYLIFFKSVDSRFDPIWQKAWHDLGVTKEMIDHQRDLMGIKQ